MLNNKTELDRIARLAKLSVLANEADTLIADLDDIVKVAQSIDDVDLTGYDCSGDAASSELREDIAVESTPPEVILRSAAESRDGFFQAPNFHGVQVKS